MSQSVRPPTPFKTAKQTPLETNFQHSLHAYQGIDPWSPDGTKLLFLGFNEGDAKGSLVVRDLKTRADTVLGQTQYYDFHTGAYQQWALGGEGVVYEDFIDDLGYTGVLTLPQSSHSSKLYPGLHIRAVSKDNQRGYGTIRRKPRFDAAAARIDFATGKIEQLFTAEEAAAHVPAEFAEDCEYHVNHTVPNHDESLMFFKLCKPSPTKKVPGRMEDWGVFFVYDLKKKTFFSLGQRISGHPQWLGGSHVVNVMQPLDGSNNRWIVTQDVETAGIEKLIDLPIEGPGHPVVSPDGRYLATDGYTANHLICPLYLIDLQTGQTAEIARFDHSTKVADTYQPHTIFRSNVHPVWSPDSRQLLVNFNQGGRRLGMILLEDFLA